VTNSRKECSESAHGCPHAGTSLDGRTPPGAASACVSGAKSARICTKVTSEYLSSGVAQLRWRHDRRLPSVRAYFITFSAYGTRLRGDDRGSVDRRANVYGTPFLGENPRLEAAHRAAMKWPEYRMSDLERRRSLQAPFTASASSVTGLSMP